MNRWYKILNNILNVLCATIMVAFALILTGILFFEGVKVVFSIVKNNNIVIESRFVNQNGEDISKDITVIIDTNTGVSYMTYSNASHSDIVVLLNKDGKPLISEVQTND